jgi:glycosyltransferase involved in cell wall biosynthesis
MRVACVSTDPGIPYGGTKGASVHLTELAAAFAGEGAEVLVLVPRCARGAAPEPPGLRVEVLPEPQAGRCLGRQRELGAWLVRRLARFEPAVLYERLALHSAAGTIAARILGIPHVVEVNAPLREEARRYRNLEEPALAERLERIVLRCADLVLPVSPPLAGYVEAQGARRVEVLPNAVAIERYPPRQGTNGVPPVAVFAGSLRPWHGIDTIAAAWRLLGASAPRLLVLGDGPARALLDGIDATVVGAVPPARVPALLAGADIGLAPYGADAPGYFSPLKLFEYLAAGLATVVADLPGVGAVVDRQAAVLIPPGDASALAGSVAGLVEDPERRRRLGENGRALVVARHSWAHRARRILASTAELSRTGAPA